MLSMWIRLIRRDLHRGAHTGLAPGMHPEHLCREEEEMVTPSGPATFDHAERRALLGLAACLGHDAKMPRLRFYNQRSRHEHSMSTPPWETACRTLRVNPRHPGSRSSTGRSGVATFPSGLDAGPPCGHPASNGCVLDGTRTGFGPINGRWALARFAVGLRRFFGSPECPVDREPLRPLCGGWSWYRRAVPLPDA
jgi:hypothetical protein